MMRETKYLFSMPDDTIMTMTLSGLSEESRDAELKKFEEDNWVLIKKWERHWYQWRFWSKFTWYCVGVLTEAIIMAIVFALLHTLTNGS